MFVTDLRHLRAVVQAHFGKRALFRGIQPTTGYPALERGSIQFLAYDSFALIIVIQDEPYTSLGFAFQATDSIATSTILGTDLTFVENTETDIREALALVDRFCRLRLPDKFLAAYDAL